MTWDISLASLGTNLLTQSWMTISSGSSVAVAHALTTCVIIDQEIRMRLRVSVNPSPQALLEDPFGSKCCPLHQKDQNSSYHHHDVSAYL